MHPSKDTLKRKSIFYLLIYKLFKNDHSISYHETRRKSDVVPLFTQVPEGELFQRGHFASLVMMNL